MAGPESQEDDEQFEPNAEVREFASRMADNLVDQFLRKGNGGDVPSSIDIGESQRIQLGDVHSGLAGVPQAFATYATVGVCPCIAFEGHVLPVSLSTFTRTVGGIGTESFVDHDGVMKVRSVATIESSFSAWNQTSEDHVLWGRSKATEALKEGRQWLYSESDIWIFPLAQ